MATIVRRIAARGFTLIELLVVIAIIAILASILIPAANNAILKGALTKAKSNGRSMYISAFQRSLDGVVVQDVSTDWPRSKANDAVNGFNDSTEFLRLLVTNKTLNVSFDFFAEKGVEPYKGTDPTKFEAKHNSWSVVGDITETTPDSTPFLVTRNLSGTRLPNTEGADVRALLTDDGAANKAGLPFGKRAIVFVTKGGSAKDLLDEQVTMANFNPALTNNVILRPGDVY